MLPTPTPPNRPPVICYLTPSRTSSPLLLLQLWPAACCYCCLLFLSVASSDDTTCTAVLQEGFPRLSVLDLFGSVLTCQAYRAVAKFPKHAVETLVACSLMQFGACSGGFSEAPVAFWHRRVFLFGGEGPFFVCVYRGHHTCIVSEFCGGFYVVREYSYVLVQAGMMRVVFHAR